MTNPIKSLARSVTQYEDRRKAVFQWRLATAPLRLLPDFIVIAAPKCGTTSLFRYLEKHPNMLSVFKKEIFYFTWHYEKGLNWYKAHFDFKMAKNDHFITGEASPTYYQTPGAIDRIKAVVPNVKLIAIVRDPVERAYSDFLFRKSIEPLSFEAALRTEAERIAPHVEQLYRDASYRSQELVRAYLWSGLYSDHLTPWLNAFPREQFLILNSEALFEHPAETMKTVTDFLNIPPHYLDEYRAYLAQEKAPMLPETREWLIDYYREPNAQFYDLAGRDFGWAR